MDKNLVINFWLVRSQNGQKSCDKLLARLISYIHHTSEYQQHCNLAMQTGIVSRLWFCKRSWSSKIKIKRNSVHFAEVTRWCTEVGCAKKQTKVWRCFSEAEIIFLDLSLRMDCIPAVTYWDLKIHVFHSVPNWTDGPKKKLLGNPSTIVKRNAHTCITIKVHQHCFGETRQQDEYWIKLIRRSVDFSSTIERCIFWLVNGKAAEKSRRIKKKIQKTPTIPRLIPGTANGNKLRGICCPKQ